MRGLAEAATKAIMAAPFSGSVTVPSRDPSWPFPVSFDLGAIQNDQLTFLSAFSSSMAMLQDMAEKELAKQPFSPSEVDALKNIVEKSTTYTGFRRWNGCTERCFILTRWAGGGQIEKSGCDVWDPLVADVHTDLPDQVVGDPGAVIHEATGNVHLMLMAVDNGPDRMVYAGPVLSHYEFEVPGVNRLSDTNWQSNPNDSVPNAIGLDPLLPRPRRLRYAAGIPVRTCSRIPNQRRDAAATLLTVRSAAEPLSLRATSRGRGGAIPRPAAPKLPQFAGPRLQRRLSGSSRHRRPSEHRKGYAMGQTCQQEGCVDLSAAFDQQTRDPFRSQILEQPGQSHAGVFAPGFDLPRSVGATSTRTCLANRLTRDCGAASVTTMVVKSDDRP